MKKIDEGKIKVVKLIDLINEVKKEPEPKFIWRGIPENSYGLITGVAKTGKTTFAENLAISISIGKEEFFGYKMDGIPRKVLFINLEEPYRIRCRRNLKQISILNDDEMNHFINNFETTPKEFLDFVNDENDWIRLHNYIKSSDAEVVFIDSLTHMFNGKIEDSSAGRKFTQLYTKYLLDIGKTVIIIHHNIKGNEKPMVQDDCAGSRVILQWFQFLFGMANIPTRDGGNYFCMLNNKYVEKDDSSAYLYKVQSNGWIELLSKCNKYDLYNYESKSKQDGRYDETNEDLIYDYMLNQYNQGNQMISTSTLRQDLVDCNSPFMSHDTLHKAKNKLVHKERLEKVSRGMYRINLTDITVNNEG